MGDNGQYIKIMSDIIDSGAWAELSASAKTLYPVLLKFSDQTFKPVWPNTETLLGLTGFKSKRSLIIAKKDLEKAGLVYILRGTGHRSSRYHFLFDYKGTKIAPLGYKNVHPGGAGSYSPGVAQGVHGGVENGSPNNINITITNKQVQTDKNKKVKPDLSELVDTFGAELFAYAVEAARKNGIEGNYYYLKKICENKMATNVNLPKNKQDELEKPSWISFLAWAKKLLTAPTYAVLESAEIEIDGLTLLVKSSMNEYLKQLTTKFFTEQARPPVIVLFSEVESIKQDNRLRYHG